MQEYSVYKADRMRTVEKTASVIRAFKRPSVIDRVEAKQINTEIN